MAPGDRPHAPQEPITIDLGFQQLVQRVDRNVTQEIIITTADKVRLCLIDALHRLEKRRAWIAPAGIVATIAVVFPTASFHDSIGLTKAYWQATFTLVALASLTWLIVSFVQMRRTVTIEQIVEDLRKQPVPAAQFLQSAGAGGPLEILSAVYSAGEKIIDVTAHLNAAVINNCLSIRADNKIAGDPLEGATKSLHVAYRVGGQRRNVTVTEGELLSLP